MSIQSISNNITRAEKEVANCDKKIADEAKKINNYEKRIIQIENSINERTSESSLKSKTNEINRKRSDVAKSQKNQADSSKKRTDQNKKVLDLRTQLAKEEEKERKKVESNVKKAQKEQLSHERRVQSDQLNHQRRITKELQIQRNITTISNDNFNTNSSKAEYDIFISHASEDKKDLVEPLALELRNRGYKVWYDKFTLKVGDSLRQKIDEGLINSRYGTIVISTSFISKNWTKYELDSMVAREMNGHKMILPIWHKVSKNEVMNFSPSLADKVALNSSIHSVEEIANHLSEVLADT